MNWGDPTVCVIWNQFTGRYYPPSFTQTPPFFSMRKTCFSKGLVIVKHKMLRACVCVCVLMYVHVWQVEGCERRLSESTPDYTLPFIKVSRRWQLLINILPQDPTTPPLSHPTLHQAPATLSSHPSFDTAAEVDITRAKLQTSFANCRFRHQSGSCHMACQ